MSSEIDVKQEFKIHKGDNAIVILNNVGEVVDVFKGGNTCIDNAVTTKNFYKFSDNIYKQIRDFFTNKEKIKNFKKVVDKL